MPLFRFKKRKTGKDTSLGKPQTIKVRPQKYGQPRAVEKFAEEGPVSKKRIRRRQKALGGSKAGRSREPSPTQKKFKKEQAVPRKDPLARSRSLISQSDRRTGLQRIQVELGKEADQINRAISAARRTAARTSETGKEVGRRAGRTMGAAGMILDLINLPRTYRTFKTIEERRKHGKYGRRT